ncbi:MAG: hypothetical protein LBL80_03555 [Ruminococcus sp.]|jgi:hypothetical protein|nr:hypothetical protein [Ruminococcus sp.]
MKKFLPIVLILAILTACNEKQEFSIDTNPAATSITTVTDASESFSNTSYSGDGYTFEFSDSGDNYIITGVCTDRDIIFTVENRYYEVSTCIDSLPVGYKGGVLSEENCFLLPGRFPSDPAKELLQVVFTIDIGGTVGYVSKIYGIKDGVFMPLELFDNTLHMMTHLSVLPDRILLPVEINKFMPPPDLVYTENGNAVVSINTYTFDPNTMTFTKAIEKISVDNPLYFGYAAMTVCNDIYSYFTDRTLTVDTTRDFEPYFNNSTGTDEYYFAVDDPRFSTLAELETYVKRYFSEDIAAEMFRQAPQKYRDINGVLHTLQVNNVRDASLGSVILTDSLVEDVNNVYPVEQFRTINGATSLEPLEDFIIRTNNAPRWTALKYKYPYK